MVDFVSRAANLETRVSSQMLQQLTMDDRKSLPHSPPLAPRWPADFDPTCAEWWKWVGNPWHGNPCSDPGEPPSDLDSEDDESDAVRERGDLTPLGSDGLPYLLEGNGFDENYISDGAMADCEDSGLDEDYISDSDGAMADCEDNGKNLERIISTTSYGKVANLDCYKSRLT